MKKTVTWKDIMNNENLLIEGSGDDLFLINTGRKDDEGDPLTQLIPKEAILEMADYLRCIKK